jgi:hypothetical protein
LPVGCSVWPVFGQSGGGKVDSLLEKLKRLDEITDRLEYLSNQADVYVASSQPDSMHKFVAGRRKSAALFFELSRLTAETLEALPADRRSVHEPVYRELFSELRRAMVDLQADWPLPAIIADIPGYQVRKASFNSKLAKFADHVRHQFHVVVRKEQGAVRGL